MTNFEPSIYGKRATKTEMDDGNLDLNLKISQPVIHGEGQEVNMASIRCQCACAESTDFGEKIKVDEARLVGTVHSQQCLTSAQGNPSATSESYPSFLRNLKESAPGNTSPPLTSWAWPLRGSTPLPVQHRRDSL